MIRLAAADLDGTLLDSSHRLPPDMGEIISALDKKGIKFAAASGRQYYSVKSLFDTIGVSDKMIFMAENGGIILENDRVLHCEALPADAVREFIRITDEMPYVRVLLSGAGSAYIRKGSIDRDFGFNADLYCDRLTEIERLEEAVDIDDIIKIAIYDRDAENGCYPVLKNYGGRFNVVLSNVQWVDIVSKNVSKGSGLAHIAEYMGITPSEVMAFGDYLNDLDMIRWAWESYAMENGHSILKAAAKHIAPSNDQYGVAQILKTLL